MLIDAARSVLVSVDVQERLCPVMCDPRRVLVEGARLVQGAKMLDVPVIVTEQYPEGIGPTMVDIRSHVTPDEVITKRTFSAMREPAFADRLATLGRSQVVVAGIEAHVCVSQSALEMKAAGYDVFVVAEACASRRPEHADEAMRRLAAAGCSIVAVEAVLFEWLADSRNPKFRDVLSKLIK